MKAALATISIHALRTPATIGIHPWEKRYPQLLIIDAKFALNQLPKKDNIDQTCDYAAIALFIRHFCKNNPRELIETLAHELCGALSQAFQFDAMTVTITKPYALPNSQGASISVQQTQFN